MYRDFSQITVNKRRYCNTNLLLISCISLLSSVVVLCLFVSNIISDIKIVLLSNEETRRDLGQVVYLQLPVRFSVKLRYSIRAVVGSASE